MPDKTAKHTPGDWAVYRSTGQSGETWFVGSWEDKQKVVCSGITNHADAHLIAAAKKLVDACKDLYHEMSALHEMPARKRHILKAAREAIAQAEPKE